MGTQLQILRRRVREELRAEGPDGAGYSSFIIDEHINSALQALSANYPIRDETSFGVPGSVWATGETYAEEALIHNSFKWYICTDSHTADGDNEPGAGDDWEDYWREATSDESNRFDLDDYIDTSLLDKIIRVIYDGRTLMYTGPNEFDLTRMVDGEVRSWYLWGTDLLLFGDLEPEKTVEMWIIRMPQKVKEDEDEVELPPYTDEAIVQYAVAGCYRESRDYDRASQHYRNFLHQEERLRTRGIPQGQRARPPMMRSLYWPPMSGRRGRMRTTDTNPGGKPQ